MKIEEALSESYEIGFDTAFELFSGMFRAAGMEDAEMMMRAGQRTRKTVMQENAELNVSGDKND